MGQRVGVVRCPLTLPPFVGFPPTELAGSYPPVDRPGLDLLPDFGLDGGGVVAAGDFFELHRPRVEIFADGSVFHALPLDAGDGAGVAKQLA